MQTPSTEITPAPVPWHGRAMHRLRSRLGERTGGVVLALLAEVLIILALLSLSIAPPGSQQDEQALTVFGVSPEPSEEPVEEDSPAPSQDAAQSPEPQDSETPPTETPSPVIATQPSPVPPAIVQMPSAQPAQPKASPQIARPKANPGRVYGPPDKGVPGDTERVGSAPNGEPLYAAAWYREPYDDELSGYLSTARGPGSALIACRTVPDFRVEDCVQLGESPSGSGIGRAVIAAAWQFRVRPPRVGGISKVGEWVRIRIDYTTRRQ